MASRVKHKDERPRKAYVMSKIKDANGNQLHPWAEIADRYGYNSGDAAQMAARRYERALRPDEEFDREALWYVPSAQKAEYCYRMWLLTKRRESNKRMTAGEVGQLVKFEEAVAPMPEAPYGLAVFFDESDNTWKMRPRREGEGMFVEQ